MGSLSRWEKEEHGKCYPGHHLHYRIRRSFWIELRCKLCYEVEILVDTPERESA